MTTDPATAERSSSRVSPMEDPHSPYYLHHSDHHGTVVVTPELNGGNYASWSRSFLLALSIRNKEGFVDGTIKEPEVSSPLYSSWYRCNSLIVAWLLKSVTPTIATTVLYMKSASQIWEKLKIRFAQPDDARICNLQMSLCTISQGTHSVDSYFNELNTVWEELRNYRPLPYCSCGKCADACFQKFITQYQQDSVFRFLNGLNDSFAALRSQILMMKPFPTLDEAFNLVLREESQRFFQIQAHPLPESAAMSVSSASTLANYSRSVLSENSVVAPVFQRKKFDVEVTCNYCKKPGHIKENCYKLVGFPPNFKFAKVKRNGRLQGTVNSVPGGSYSIVEDKAGDADGELTVGNGGKGSLFALTQEQVQQLLSLLNDSRISTPVANLVVASDSSQITKPPLSDHNNVSGSYFKDQDWSC